MLVNKGLILFLLARAGQVDGFTACMEQMNLVEEENYRQHRDSRRVSVGGSVVHIIIESSPVPPVRAPSVPPDMAVSPTLQEGAAPVYQQDGAIGGASEGDRPSRSQSSVMGARLRDPLQEDQEERTGSPASHHSSRSNRTPRYPGSSGSQSQTGRPPDSGAARRSSAISPEVEIRNSPTGARPRTHQSRPSSGSEDWGSDTSSQRNRWGRRQDAQRHPRWGSPGPGFDSQFGRQVEVHTPPGRRPRRPHTSLPEGILVVYR